MNGPYFLVDGLDITMYANRSDVEFVLEAIDVMDERVGRYFAADGTILKLEVSGGRWGRVVSTDTVLGHDPQNLAQALRAYLLLVSEPKSGRVTRRRQRAVDRDLVQRADLGMLVDEFSRVAEPLASGFA